MSQTKFRETTQSKHEIRHQGRPRFVYQEDEEMEKAFSWKQMRRLLHYLLPYRRQVIPMSLLFMLVGTVTKLGIPLLMSWCIDKVLMKGNGSMLPLYVGSMLLLYVLQWGANVGRIRLTSVMGQKAIFDLRADLFQHIQKLSFRFFDKRPSGSVLVRITNDVNSLQDLLANGAVNTLIDCIQLISVMVILLFLNVKLALAIMLIVPLMFVVSQTVRLGIRHAWQQVRTQQSQINAHLNESIQGIRVTQAYTQEQANIRYFSEMNEQNRLKWNRAMTINNTFGPLIEITMAVGTFILFWYGSYQVQSGAITVGMLVAFANYIGSFWEPINRLGGMYSQLLVAMASSERIFEFLDEKPIIDDKPDAVELPPIQGRIRMNQVGFEYEEGRPALRGITLEAEPGQSVALVGHTGSGKSTVINLLCRFYDPSAGNIEIDGFNLRDVTLQSLRTQIGIVLQDTFIFSGSIRDNIRFGKLDASNEEIEWAAKAVHAHDFICKLPNGYDTEVEERGNILSMGQRQLISFARALLSDPRILILDEATASIDTETELKIQEALKVLLAGRTSLIVAHRLSTIRNADKIIVLDHGIIKEEGKHSELMERRRDYYGLIKSQYKLIEEGLQRERA